MTQNSAREVKKPATIKPKSPYRLKKLPPLPKQPPPGITAYHAENTSLLLKILLLVFFTVFFITIGMLWLLVRRSEDIKKTGAARTTSPSPPAPTLTPKPEPAVPADWLTYRNEKYRFEIQYPPFLEIRSKDASPSSGLASHLYLGEQTQLFIIAPKRGEEEITNSWVDFEAFYVNKFKVVKELSYSNPTDGDSSALVQVQYLIDLPSANVLVIFNEKTGGEYELFLSVLNQIISTVKYLDPFQESCADEKSGSSLTYQQAVETAKNSLCGQQGQLMENHFCNQNTGSWWIDLNIDRPGCEPACVVSVVDQTAYINWRCTGAVAP